MLNKLTKALAATVAAIPALIRIKIRDTKGGLGYCMVPGCWDRHEKTYLVTIGGQLVQRKLCQGHYDSTVYYAKKAQERIHPNCRCNFIPIDNKGVNEQ